MPTNDFLVVSADPSANVDAQATFLSWPRRLTGFISGIAPSSTMNKIFRQTTFIANLIAQFIVDELAVDQLDDGNSAGALANFKLAVGKITRIKLMGNLNLYVATTGSDTLNNGLSVGSPFATLQKAWNTIIFGYDLNGFVVTINVANGTYPQGVVAVGTPVGSVAGVRNGPSPPWPSGPSINFIGNPSSPASCFINVSGGNCFSAANGTNISISGFKLAATGVGSDYNQIGTCIYAFGSSGIQFSNLEFGTAAGPHIASTVGSIVESFGAPYTISGGATAHAAAFDNGYVTISGSTVTLVGTPRFASGFITISNNGTAYVNGGSTVFSGTATGNKYFVDSNGALLTNGAGANFFPGDTAGVKQNGGQYL